MSAESPPAVAYKDYKLLPFVALIRKRTVKVKKKKEKKSNSRFLFPVFRFSAPRFNFSAFNLAH